MYIFGYVNGNTDAFSGIYAEVIIWYCKLSEIGSLKQSNDAIFWSHSNNEFYTVKSSYYVAKIMAVRENLI